MSELSKDGSEIEKIRTDAWMEAARKMERKVVPPRVETSATIEEIWARIEDRRMHSGGQRLDLKREKSFVVERRATLESK